MNFIKVLIAVPFFCAACSVSPTDEEVIAANGESIESNDSTITELEKESVYEGLKMSHVNGEQIHGVTKFADGTLTEASDNTGLPYQHWFVITMKNGNEMRFDFADYDKYSGAFLDYVGLKCKVDFIPMIENHMTAMLAKNGDRYDTINVMDINDAFKYSGVSGILNTDKEPSGDLPSDFSVTTDNGEFYLVSFLSDKEIAQTGKEVKLHYRQKIRNHAMTVQFFKPELDYK